VDQVTAWRWLVAAAALGRAAQALAQGGGEEAAGPPERRAARVTVVLPPGDEAESSLVEVARGAPVTRHALRLTAQRLFQAGRCRDVVIHEAEASPPPGEKGRWVDLTVTCVPNRLLGTLEVQLEGPSPLDPAALRAAAALELGSPVDEVDLRVAADRVRAALRRRGWRQAVVEAAISGEQPATAVLRVRAGPATTVRELRLPGAGPLEQARLAGLGLRAGAVLDEDRLAADVVALRAALRQDGYWRGRVGTPVVRDEPPGAVVEIPVEAGPRVVLAFVGAVAFTPAELRPLVGADTNQDFDAPAIQVSAARLRAFYRARGYAAARVEAHERSSGKTLVVAFHVDEGRTYRLRPFRFEGNEHRPEAELREHLAELLAEEAGAATADPGAERARALAASVPGVPALREPPPALAPGAAYDELLLERSLKRILGEYEADGFQEAALTWTTELDASSGEVEVQVRLREGVRTTVESIAYEGNVGIPLPELVKLTQLAPGAPLVYEQVETTRLALLKLYLDRSYIYARVEARQQVDPVRHQAQVRFVVQEGPRVRLGRILVSGNARTREDLVRRSLEVKEGAWHDPEAMARSQAALLRLGVFRSVGLRLQDPEVPEPVKDLVVELAERPWQYLAPGAGFSIANGPRLFLEYGRPNLLGRALELTARTKVNYPLAYFRPDLQGVSPKNTYEGRADVGLRAPRVDLFPVPVTGRADLIAEQLRRKAYDLRRASAILGSDWAVAGRFSLSLQYELEVDRIDKTGVIGNLTQADLQALRFPEGVTTLQSLRPSFTLDYRDNASHPHRGWFATGSAELEHSIGSKTSQFLFFPGSDNFSSLVKLQGTLSGYLPMGRTMVLALSLRGGRILPLDSRSITISPKRFFLGGAGDMRGFAEEEMVPQDRRDKLAEERSHCASSLTATGCTPSGAVLAAGQTVPSDGAELFLLLKAELRVALAGNLELGFFVDAGNLWFDSSHYRLVELRPNAGLGLRIVTPIGPAALDLGFNLNPDRRLNESTFAPHFTIGLF
jgi:outer membrane protein assembly factor BamA